MTEAVLQVAVPVIGTERLILREPRVADLDAVAAFMASDRAGFVGGPLDRQQSWRSILVTLGHWLARGYGYWVVEERGTGAVAGRVGVHYHEVDWPEPELGWQIYEGFEGQGYAEEAARAARGAAARLGLGPLISLIDPANLRSQRLAQRLGARLEREMAFMGKPVQLWRHPGAAA